MKRMYKPKSKNEDKLTAFAEKLEKQGLFKEDIKNDSIKKTIVKLP